MARRRKKGEEKQIARHRIRTLLDQARREAQGPDADLADRYAGLVLRVAKRYQVRLPADQKQQVCRKCHAYQVPGRTSRTRIHAGRIVRTCLACGHTRRRPLGPRAPSGRTRRTRAGTDTPATPDTSTHKETS